MMLVQKMLCKEGLVPAQSWEKDIQPELNVTVASSDLGKYHAVSCSLVMKLNVNYVYMSGNQGFLGDAD